MPAAEILAGAAAAGLAGRSALPRGRPFSPSALAEDVLLGLALVVPLGLAWGLAGLPWTPVSMPVLGVGLAASLRLFVRQRSWRREDGDVARPIDRAAEILFAACALLAAWKWIRTPLWSFDHFAIWGLKARRLIVDGGLDLAFLGLTPYVPSNPQYPLGLPLAWRFLSPSEPSGADFRLCHGLFAAALLASMHAAARRLGASRAAAALVAAAVCASPLLWDTEAVGLAELPLAAFAIAGLLLALEARDDTAFPAWTAGATLGFLGWVKAEGLPLGLLLAAVSASLVAGRRRLSLLAAWLLSSIASLAVQRWLLPEGIEFLEGPWASRLASRASEPLPILSAMLRELVGSEWFGVWFLFGAALLGSLLLRGRSPRLLAGVVLAQLLVYAFVYGATFMDPAKHVEASLHRLAAALLPLALLAIVAGSAVGTDPREPGQPGGAPLSR